MPDLESQNPLATVFNILTWPFRTLAVALGLPPLPSPFEGEPAQDAEPPPLERFYPTPLPVEPPPQLPVERPPPLALQAGPGQVEYTGPGGEVYIISQAQADFLAAQETAPPVPAGWGTWTFRDGVTISAPSYNMALVEWQARTPSTIPLTAQYQALIAERPPIPPNPYNQEMTLVYDSGQRNWTYYTQRQIDVLQDVIGANWEIVGVAPPGGTP